jgi:hypothetical protein
LQAGGERGANWKKDWKKDLQTMRTGRRSRKSPTPVVGMNSNGKSQMNAPTGIIDTYQFNYIIMKIVNILVRIVLILVILFLVTRTFKRADERSYGANSPAVFSKGNAPDSIRQEVIAQLHKFQDGYSKRDTNQVDSFMNSIYSKDNILILGTDPDEILSGYKSAAELVSDDWKYWGDCHFAMDSANVSANGRTVWFSTRGFVKADISRLLVIPLRLTGVMVMEDGTWKLQQEQCQRDVDFNSSLLDPGIAAVLLFIWLIASVISLFFVLFKSLKKRTPGVSQ